MMDLPIMNCSQYQSSTTPLKDVIRCVLIPALTSRALPNDIECDLFGGLDLTNPSKTSNLEFSFSAKFTAPLQNLVLFQNHNISLVRSLFCKLMPKHKFKE